MPDNFADCSAKRKRRFCRFVQAFPLTASGKVKKFELREMLVKEMGLEVEANIKTA
ncbi:MAG: hypothetical protein ACREEM_20410 [Blastocatellia bacterium]